MRVRILAFGLLLTFAAAVQSAELRNQLEQHPSPYLAMHGDDPVAWQEWGSEALERARRENKLVFVSIGYFSCHWCHVMQRESYRDPEVAALLNRHFIPVKVDRELQPALDARLIEFVEKTRGYSGWPLNVFLTPDGNPLLGLVYLPRDDFHQLLSALQQRWQQQPAELARTAARAGAELSRGEVSPGPDLPAGLADRLSEALTSSALKLGDPLEGGFGSANKFPQAAQLAVLLRLVESDASGKLEPFLRLTLDHMASQGLRDHLRGGFFRYTVDPGWKIPHFEKMLYDNALLAEVYLAAAQRLNEPRYRDVAEDTLQFMAKELADPSGALIASLSAVDEQGVEGGYYLWSRDTLESLLSPEEMAVVNVRWGLDVPAELEAGHLPVHAAPIEQVASRLGISADRAAALEASAAEKLRTAQRQRGLPRDTKLLAAWNGLALRAFSTAAQVTGKPEYRRAAQAIRDYLVDRLWNGERLLRARGPGGDLGDAALEDYAYVASGLQAWAALTGEAADWKLSRTLNEQAWKRFHSRRGWRLSEDPLIPYAANEAVVADGPMPSPSAEVIITSLILADRFKDAEMRKRAHGALNVGHKALTEEPFWFATQVEALRRAQDPGAR